MFVQLHNLHVEKLVGGSTVCFTVDLDYFHVFSCFVFYYEPNSKNLNRTRRNAYLNKSYLSVDL